MRVVFLDVDGVLLTERCYRYRSAADRRAQAEPSCVAALNDITRQAGAVIVVSSTWRGLGLEKISAILRGWKVAATVIDVTPDLNDFTGVLWKARSRGDEIATWLRNHPETEAFVILDDDADMGSLCARLVRTTMSGGLSIVNVAPAVDHLRTPYTHRQLVLTS